MFEAGKPVKRIVVAYNGRNAKVEGNNVKLTFQLGNGGSLWQSAAPFSSGVFHTTPRSPCPSYPAIPFPSSSLIPPSPSPSPSIPSGSLWQSAAPFSSGVFHTALSCPSGNTSGLLVSFGLSNTGSTGQAAGVTFDMVGSNKQMLLATLHRSGKAFPTSVPLFHPRPFLTPPPSPSALSNTGSTGPAAGVTFDMVGSNKQMLLATLHRSGKAFPTQVSLPSPCDSVPARLSLYWDAHYVSWYVNRQLVRYLLFHITNHRHPHTHHPSPTPPPTLPTSCWYVNRQLVRYLPRSSSPLRFPAVPLILFGTIKAAALTNLGGWAGKMSGDPLPKTAMWTGVASITPLMARLGAPLPPTPLPVVKWPAALGPTAGRPSPADCPACGEMACSAGPRGGPSGRGLLQRALLGLRGGH
ncbi:unnamed protein product [Closterium sp. Naga37s-1]|nr:unnamed protein product [Closterium sp. Naga37s-1]